MTLASEKQIEHLGETCGCADHDHDLVHELNKRLDALWRYDQRIANAAGHPALQTFWRNLKAPGPEKYRAAQATHPRGDREQVLLSRSAVHVEKTSASSQVLPQGTSSSPIFAPTCSGCRRKTSRSMRPTAKSRSRVSGSSKRRKTRGLLLQRVLVW